MFFFVCLALIVIVCVGIVEILNYFFDLIVAIMVVLIIFMVLAIIAEIIEK